MNVEVEMVSRLPGSTGRENVVVPYTRVGGENMCLLT